MRVLKRVLTRKSILNFGFLDVRDLSVQMLLDLGNHNTLINAYFNLEKIDFTEDILDELGITSEFRLIKPSKNYDLAKEFYTQKYSTMTDTEKLKHFSRKKKITKLRVVSSNYRNKYSEKKGYLKAKNQGNLKK